MEFLTKLERKVLQWAKGIPHLPIGVRKWLGYNVWWFSVVGAIVTGLASLGLLVGLFGNIATLNSPFSAYYASTTFVMWLVINTAISFVFMAISCLLFAFSVTPLKERQKKGWVLLFAVWLVSILAVAVGAVLTFNPLTFIVNVIFGVLWLAVTGYFIFEIHGQFAHVERSEGVKGKKTV